MQPMTSTTWQTNLSQAIRQDPKRTGVLLVLAAVLLLMVGRAFLGGSHPAAAAGSLPSFSADVVPPLPGMESQQTGPGRLSSLHEWLSAPIPAVSRNVFLIKPEFFPLDGSKPSQQAADGAFWADLEKSLSLQADQRDKRENLIENYKTLAAAIRPSSTIMGPSPRAMINGMLVREGDVVASFRVLKIEPRGIIVEREGIRLEIPMK